MNWRHVQRLRNITGKARSRLTFLKIFNAPGFSHWVKFIEEEDLGHVVRNQTKICIHIRCLLRSWAIGQLPIPGIYFFCWFSNQEGKVQRKISKIYSHRYVQILRYCQVLIWKPGWQIGWNQSALINSQNTIFSKLGKSWNVLLAIDLRQELVDMHSTSIYLKSTIS